MRSSTAFQSTHPVRGATMRTYMACRLPIYFNPRTPCGVRPGIRGCWAAAPHFNPRTPCGMRRLNGFGRSRPSRHFNPRTPCGVRRSRRWRFYRRRRFQSTHPVRGATDTPCFFAKSRSISIHAPRAGCDMGIWEVGVDIPISIHAPRAGCDTRHTFATMMKSVFQSTHPVRGATSSFFCAPPARRISIHAPRAGCDHRQSPSRREDCISIHAPRAGCDPSRQPFSNLQMISIHAPRAGCDTV